jgi:DeoR/GlpR family transcriptional regulator of sugar metabolism
MRVARHVVDARRRKWAELVRRHRYLETGDLCKEFGISEATVRRDLASLEKSRLITRTFGGALSEYNMRFPSFRQRQTSSSSEKQRLAKQAHKLLRPEMVVFLDGGTTIFALAETLRESPVKPLTCVTSNLPVADLLSEVEGLSVHLLGGQVLRRQSVLLGDEALLTVVHWEFDLALLGAEGMTREGLWNSQPAVVDLQRAVISQSRCAVALVDRSKLGHTTQHFLGGWNLISGLLTETPREALRAEGIPNELSDIEHIGSFIQSVDSKKDRLKKQAIQAKENEKYGFSLPTSLL